ncbi:MAG: Holliday junction resolvase RecU [Mycoplasmataceae bacterium]|nr:Holliday junction resolvase RecU [Mycoplasmataceae bacterium]
MNHNIKSNRGMYVEEIIARTCEYYSVNNIALIEKRQLPIKIVKNINNNMVVGKLLSRSTIDYSGVYHGFHIEFEAKQTNELFLSLSLLKLHQITHMQNLCEFNVNPFLIVYMEHYDKFFLVDFRWLFDKIAQIGKKQVSYEVLSQECQSLVIEHPGIINFIKYLKH